MSYPVEIITTSETEIKTIELAIGDLNRIQDEFQFKLASKRLLDQCYMFTQENYTSEEVADWLDDYRTKNVGYRPYIILVLTGTLNTNHFGGHVASHGFAFFTTNGHYQFVVDKIRYIKYYLVRYVLSFLNPAIKGHDKAMDCMFDRKLWKPEIQLSLNSGRLCDECSKQLRPYLNQETNPAIDIFLKHISKQFPYALVLKGGGVKGLALVGALIELENHYSFNTFAGTSAGAIAAVLLAAGYNPNELKEILSTTNFKDFIEGGVLNWIFNLFAVGGAVPGDQFVAWLDELLVKKIEGKVSAIQMRDLPQRAIVYASRRNEGVIKFDSKGDRDESYARFAVRCSMSIPGFFAPKKMDDEYVYDGGIGNNFPLRTFMTDNKNHLFIGIYLKGSAKSKTIVGDLIDIATDGDERAIVEANIDKIVIIDPSPIKTTQFGLNKKQMLFLVNAGRLGALEFLHKYNPDAGITIQQIIELRQTVNKQKFEL